MTAEHTGTERTQRDEVRAAASEIESAAGEAKHAAADAARAGADRARSLMDEQRHDAAERIHGVAAALRSTADGLEERDGASSRLTRGAADRVDELARALDESDLSTLRHRAEGFARRSPAVFLGGAVTAGFLLGRFLKSTDHRPADGSSERAGEPTRTRRST